MLVLQIGSVACGVFYGVFCAVLFFPLDVLDGVWVLIKSVSEGFLTYSSGLKRAAVACAILEKYSVLRLSEPIAP